MEERKVPCSAAEYSTACTVQYSTAQCSTVQYSTVQYSTVQYSTVQYSALQCRIAGYITSRLMGMTGQDRTVHRRTGGTQQLQHHELHVCNRMRYRIICSEGKHSVPTDEKNRIMRNVFNRSMRLTFRGIPVYGEEVFWGINPV